MSEGEACRRVAAARLVRRFPTLLPRIESGALNLTTLYMLRDLFTASNVESLANDASEKTKREVEEIVAKLAPRPDVASKISTLPTPARVLPGMNAPPPAAIEARARMPPLAPERFEVRFTASAELRDNIELARERLRHRHPNGDLEAVMTRAFDALLE